ncbi:hypothetical protein X797_007146 [Metarhizium robertsii]|uniref:Uncharacterized protein n=1 Tax=Metarhizium robertsii TaxID=568076 RepID=A0A0A1UT79_9HYPO|nr:hypothetical protein X797_007146 [Metarhizium robertsii]
MAALTIKLTFEIVLAALLLHGQDHGDHALAVCNAAAANDGGTSVVEQAKVGVSDIIAPAQRSEALGYEAIECAVGCTEGEGARARKSRELYWVGGMGVPSTIWGWAGRLIDSPNNFLAPQLQTLSRSGRSFKHKAASVKNTTP